MTHTTSVRNSTEERALQLLGAGYSPEVVANSCGVTVGRIAQLLSDDEFKEAVTAIKVENLNKHNKRDSAYDSLEDSLLEKLKESSMFLSRPMEIAKVLATVNAAKRRGVSSNETITNQQTVVSIVMPTKIVQRFTTNTNNQVISAGSQELLTIQASALKNLSSSLKGTGNENEPARVGIAPEDPGSSKTETSGRE